MDEKQLRRVEGIINSMTPEERMRAEILKASRKKGALPRRGVPVQEGLIAVEPVRVKCRK